MSDKSSLPFLIKLMDDASPRVRDKVARELRAFGSELEDELARLQIVLSPAQRRFVDALLEEKEENALFVLSADADASAGTAFDADAALQREWLDWLDIADENQKLEAALDLLARWQLGGAARKPLGVLLDEMADDFRSSGYSANAQDLSRFLFGEEGLGFKGAVEGMSDPLSSNLVHVIATRRGIPLSLSAVFVLVGHRLGLDISGCHFPGHFLARARLRDDSQKGARELIFDPFNGGRVLSSTEAAALHKAAPQAMSVRSSVLMVARTLRNMVVGFEHSGDLSRARFVLGLLHQLEQAADV